MGQRLGPGIHLLRDIAGHGVVALGPLVVARKLEMLGKSMRLRLQSVGEQSFDRLSDAQVEMLIDKLVPGEEIGA